MIQKYRKVPRVKSFFYLSNLLMKIMIISFFATKKIIKRLTHLFLKCKITKLLIFSKKEAGFFG